MNSPESTDAAHNDEQAAGLWRGAAGGLKLDARRALVQLLKGPVLDGMRMPVIWKALLESEDLIRSRLNDLFLDLVIDREQLFAFTRQADTDPVKAPILLKRKPLNYIETYLFLFLRLRLSSAEGRGERAVIGLDEVKALADLPSREVLLAKLIGSMQAPISGLVNVLHGTLRNFVYVVDAVRQKKEQESA